MNLQKKRLFTIGYWLVAALCLVLLLFALFLSHFRHFRYETLYETRKGYLEQANGLFLELEHSLTPHEWWNLDQAPEAALQSLTTFRLPGSLEGDAYFLSYDQGTLLSPSTLPVGHPTITTVSSTDVLHTAVYQRSSDGASVISFFRTISPRWVFAVDILADSIAAYLQPFQTPDYFFYLIDTRSKQILAASDFTLPPTSDRNTGSGSGFGSDSDSGRNIASVYNGCPLEETDSPLLEPLRSGNIAHLSEFTVKDETGGRYYGILYEIPHPDSSLYSPKLTFWSVASYCSYHSLIEEFFLKKPSFWEEYWGVAALYLLVVLLLWLAIRPARKEAS